MRLWQNPTEKDVEICDYLTTVGPLVIGLTGLLLDYKDDSFIIVDIIIIIYAMILLMRWKKPYKHRVANLLYIILFSVLFTIIIAVQYFYYSRDLILSMISVLIYVIVIILAYYKRTKLKGQGDVEC